ncbi:hypothetical protein VYU27_003869 [Nannochloropsis oceanica]
MHVCISRLHPILHTYRNTFDKAPFLLEVGQRAEAELEIIMPRATEATPLNASDASHMNNGVELITEERFTSPQGRSILAFGLTVISVIFVLFIILTTLPHDHGKEKSSDPTTASPALKPISSHASPSTPAPSTPAKFDTAAVGSPINPHPRVNAPGCPSLGVPPPGRRFIQIKNNCQEPIWPGIIPAGSAVPPGNTWLWKAGECKTVEVASTLPSLRVWGRTQCNEDFNCVTGSCRVEGNGGCVSAGEAPCSLWEATLQDHCTPKPVAGMGPDFFDTSLVDGYNLPIRAQPSGGFNVGQVQGAFSCQAPVANTFDFDACPYELRVYSDSIPGTNLPVEGLAGKNQVTSPCFQTPLNATCRAAVIGCRSLCKALDQGWLGYYINNVEGPRDLVDPLLTRPTGETIRWSAQFIPQPPPGGSSSSSSSRSSTRKCDPTMLCRDVPAWGAYRGAAYAGNGNMKSLVCCDSGFRCSPYQPNNVPGGCPYAQACPTLGSSDPASSFHHKKGVSDATYPQYDEEMRMSSSLPDWPMPTKGENYAQIYKESSPSAYAWQYNDISSTYVCCGKEGQAGPSYILTFCPDE